MLDKYLVEKWVIILQTKFTKKNMFTRRKSQPLLLFGYKILLGMSYYSYQDKKEKTAQKLGMRATLQKV